MKTVYTIAIALAAIGAVAFFLGSSFLGRYIYNIRLMLTLAAVGAVLFAAGAGVFIYSILRRK